MSVPVPSSRCAHPRHELVLAVIGCFSFFGSAVSAADAPSSTVSQQVTSYALAPAPLAQTLKEIARLGGRPIDADEATLTDRTSSAVQGTLTVAQAAMMALRGTGLTLAETDDGRLLVTDALPKVFVRAQRDQAETSFKADRSDTATRSGTDLADTPQAMTIITGKVLESRQSLSVTDALANVSGVIFAQSPQGTPNISIRGFNQTSATVNGVTDSSARLTNVFGVERIEVLKGPAAILSGANSLGGGVNVVTKKPQADPIRTLTLQYGSYDDATVAGDLSGAVTDDKRLTYRLIAAESRSGAGQAGYDGRRDRSLLPQLRWKDASTDLIVGASYGKQRLAQPQFTFARADGSIRPAPSSLVGNPDDGFDTLDKSAFYQLEQQIVPHVVLVSRLQRSLSTLALHVWDALDAPDTTGVSPFFGLRQSTVSGTTSGDHYVRIEGDTGPIGHKLAVGLNHTGYTYAATTWDSNDNFVMKTVYPASGPSAVFAPMKSFLPDVSSIGTGHTEQLGVYLQELMTWGDWNLLANLRRSRYESEFGSFVPSGKGSSSANPTIWATTPGAGLVYKLTPEISLYGNYSEGFVPSSATACGIGLPPPMTTTNKEAGIKFDLMGSKLGLTVDAFDLYQSNALSYNRTGKCYTLRDAQVTRGVEADLQGQIATGWNVSMNYAFTTARDVVNSNLTVAGLSKHRVSLWTTYDLPVEALKGLGVGFGVSAATRSAGSTDATSAFQIPGQAQLDGSVFYQRAGWSVTFGVKNLADRVLYGVSNAASYIPIMPRRNYMLTVKRDFM